MKSYIIVDEAEIMASIFSMLCGSIKIMTKEHEKRLGTQNHSISLIYSHRKFADSQVGLF